MAFNMTSTNGQIQYNISEFVIDSPDDLEKLPKKCAQGSIALCTDGEYAGSVYVKNSTGEWKEI